MSSCHQIALVRSPGHPAPQHCPPPSDQSQTLKRDQIPWWSMLNQGWELSTKRPLLSDKDLCLMHIGQAELCQVLSLCPGLNCSFFRIQIEGHNSLNVYLYVCHWVYRETFISCRCYRRPHRLSRLMSSWYHHVIQQLSSWAELGIIMFVTIWQFASEPVKTNIIVFSLMSPS